VVTRNTTKHALPLHRTGVGIREELPDLRRDHKGLCCDVLGWVICKFSTSSKESLRYSYLCMYEATRFHHCRLRVFHYPSAGLVLYCTRTVLPIFFSLRNVGYDPSYTKCQLTHGSFKFFSPGVLIAHTASISPSKCDNYFLH